MNRLFIFIYLGLVNPFLTAQELAFPTENRALLRGGGPDFYQYVEREFEGIKSQPWQGGQYGFVRNPRRSNGRLVYTRFHEGIDIAPLRRDAGGEPLDVVVSVDAGQVVYATASGARSGYGKYVVVEHNWGGSPYYSLYAHLNRIDVKIGQSIARGAHLGLLGYTGSGIDRVRAHLHFEINLLLNTNFEDWHSEFFPNDPNHHGIFNGLNLAGIDVGAFYLARDTNPSLDLPTFLLGRTSFFTVRIPAPNGLQILKRYPWMTGGRKESPTKTWDLAFEASGLPLRAVPSPVTIGAAEVVAVSSSGVPHRYMTRDLVEGAGRDGKLSDAGKRLIALLAR
jgi:murein DD-endopeptidase MepM/ murein hydrolase activator NlpD